MDTRRSAIGKLTLIAGTIPAVAAGKYAGPVETGPRAATAPSAAPGPIVDVRSTGALADGKTDDSAAIQRAIDRVVQRNAQTGPGGIVYFPPGIYAVATPLAVPKNVYLVGETPIASRLHYTGPDRDVFITFGEPGQIATYSGIKSLWVESNGKTQTAVLMHGPQEGSTIEESIITGALRVVVDIRSQGIEGGSNKFTISRCWFWTIGDDGVAGVLIGPSSGPLSIRDTTMVGTNRTRAAPANSGGVVAQQSLITLDNVNVERFESHTYLDRTMATLTNVTGFFNTYGLKTSVESKNTATYLSGASFDQAEACVLDQGSDVRIGFCRSYWNEAYKFDQRQFRRNFWEVGNVGVYQSDKAQTTMGYTSAATGETARFKFSTFAGGQWRQSADIDEAGLFGAAESAHDGAHLRLGEYHLWVDAQGRLRIKQGPPTSDDDGSVVGQT